MVDLLVEAVTLSASVCVGIRVVLGSAADDIAAARDRCRCFQGVVVVVVVVVFVDLS